MSRDKGGPKSSLVIARLLDSEGFSDHTANMVTKYMRRCNKVAARRAKREKAIRKAFSAMVKAKLDEADKIVLGRMMAIHARVNFDGGLKIGLAAKLFTEDDSGE